MFPPRIEIVPTSTVVESVRKTLPPGTSIAVTCLPHHGIDRTMRSALELSAEGYPAIPHLAARSMESRPQLSGIIRDCRTAGITEIFAIGGDAPNAVGPYSSGLALLEDIVEMSSGEIEVGVAGYPEGHHHVGPLQVLDSLLQKADKASYITTQMCFSAPKIIDYAKFLRREGIVLPVWAGVAGPVPHSRLVSLATKIGVGPSLRFLSRKGPLARRLLTGGKYTANGLITDLSESPDAVAGIHLYTFNNLEDVPRLLEAANKTISTSAKGAVI
jgi:methylenetetrahydrofolate reductase (NADPH)